MNTRLLFVHALSPLHAGTGQSVGAIDLAIARDRATGMPYLPGSSLKGSLRARARERSVPNLVPVFGPDTDRAHEHAGALVLGDANLVLLPIRSVSGTYAWATSPFLLDRVARDARDAALAPAPTPKVENIEACAVTATSALKVGPRVILEDLDLKANESAEALQVAKWLGGLVFPGEANQAWREALVKRICVVHDDVMSFLALHATDVVARIALDPDHKTVRKGGLWYEENLPTESVLVASAGIVPNGKVSKTDAFAVLGELVDCPLQLGGKATVGRGRCQLVLSKSGGAQ